MKIFLDANVLVSVINQEYPLFRFSSRILSLADNPNHQVFTSPLCIAIAYYFAQKKSGNKVALSKIRLLSSHLQISPMDQGGVLQTVKNLKIHDFEDGLEYYSAMASKSDIIVTEDLDDFYFSEIPVTNCEGFWRDRYF